MTVDSGPPTTCDEELARQSQAGSLSSFEELVYRHEGRIFRFLVRCCRHEEDARELTQTTFVTAFRSLHLYQPARPFAAWLLTIARHKFIDHYRRARFDFTLDGLPEASDHDDPSAILERREQQRDIWEQVRGLVGPDQFSALWLKYQEDLSIKEIAGVLRRTQTSVKVLLFRARQTLIRDLRTQDDKEQPLAGARPVSRSRDAGRLDCAPQGWRGIQPATNLSAESQ
jgi:RNA polymerase sigma-70 factor, ECF subfamily